MVPDAKGFHLALVIDDTFPITLQACRRGASTKIGGFWKLILPGSAIRKMRHIHIVTTADSMWLCGLTRSHRSEKAELLDQLLQTLAKTEEDRGSGVVNASYGRSLTICVNVSTSRLPEFRRFWMPTSGFTRELQARRMQRDEDLLRRVARSRNIHVWEEGPDGRVRIEAAESIEYVVKMLKTPESAI